MKTDFIVMQRSAMSQQQKYSILSNEMIRRLSNTDFKLSNLDEKIKVIDQYTAELKKSEYSRLETKEIIISGIKGWKKKMSSREQKGKCIELLKVMYE